MKSDTRPTLTIVTVCFNAADTIDACIKSVAGSKSSSIEYVVIDGGSTDATMDIVQRHRTTVDRVVSEPDNGIFDAMNKGLALASGDYVAFLNADDTYASEALSAALAAMQFMPDADVLYGDWIGVDAIGKRHLRQADHRTTSRYLLCHQAVFARRSIFPKPHGFDTRYRLCADFDLLMRWRNEGRKFERLAQPIVCFSETGASAQLHRRSALESIAISLKRNRSFASLMFSARLTGYVARQALTSLLAWRRQSQQAALSAHSALASGARHTRIVVSAVNLIEGGTLTVLRQCLASAAAHLPTSWEIVALVHDKRLIDEPRIHLLEISDAKKSWSRRLYWEWWGFKRMSEAHPPALWLSLHDVTPRVVADRQAVYCHNPSPFYRVGPLEAFLEPKFFLFSLFYSALYRLFISRNRWVIVQQAWMRIEFQRRMGPLPVVVAHPVQRSLCVGSPVERRDRTSRPFVFLYPALPRLFKNFGTLCDAARMLAARGHDDFEVRLTMDGSENRTARWLHSRYAEVPGVRFIGRQDKRGMDAQYAEAAAVVFPSRLETWGLPISEGKTCGLPLLLADLPYAREAVGDYDRVTFFPATNAAALADQMHALLDGSWRPTGNREETPSEPFAPDWAHLWGVLTQGLPETSEAAPEPSDIPAVSAEPS